MLEAVRHEKELKEELLRGLQSDGERNDSGRTVSN